MYCFDVNINGRSHVIEVLGMMKDELAAMAGVPDKCTMTYNYTSGDYKGKSGMLSHGVPLLMRSGLVVNAVVT
jgi:hypothetical protein